MQTKSMFRRIVLIFGFFSPLLSAQFSLQITTPANKTIVRPGQSLAVQVSATGGTFQQVVILAGHPLHSSQILTAPPYNFTIQIPTNASPGTYSLTASGAITPGQGTESEPIDIVVEPATSPSSLIIRPSVVSIWPGTDAPLHVTGRFASGPKLNMTYSSLITYSSENPAIATVDKLGLITAVAPGKTVVGVGGYRVPVTVEPYVVLVPDSAVLYAGETIELGAQVNIPSDQSSTWSMNPYLGTLTSTGPYSTNYTAPATISTQQQVTITAKSTADPTKSAAATVTLYPPVGISINPANATLRASQTQQFTATVTNAYIAGATWSITPAGVGTISANGLYTAPTPIPANQTITIKATSNQDPTKTATATVNLRKSQ
jgi:hypothetical protein